MNICFNKNNIRINIVCIIMAIFFSAFGCCLVISSGEQAEVGSQGAEDINKSIADLSASSDGEKIKLILELIDEADVQQREVLRSAFDSKLSELFALEQDSTNQGNQSIGNNLSAEEIRNRINALKLGNNATAENLIERDKLVGSIANISDPSVREESLRYLEEKERDTE